MRLDSVRSGVGLGATNTVLDRAEDAHIHFADRQKTQVPLWRSQIADYLIT